MLEYLFGVTVILLLWLGYLYLLLPPLRMRRLAKRFRDKGFRVFELPFGPLGMPYFEMMAKHLRQHNDSLYPHKHWLFEFDLVVSNTFSHPQLIPLSPTLIQDCLSADKLHVLLKRDGPNEIFFDIVKQGILLAEGEEWKRRKRIVSKVFNYEFIASEIPHMVATANTILDQYEEEYWSEHPSDREKGQIRVRLYDLMTNFSSAIVMSCFFKDQLASQSIRGASVVDRILELSDRAVEASLDPLLVIFGLRLLKMGMREKDRYLVNLKRQIDAVLTAQVQKEAQRREQQGQGDKGGDRGDRDTLVHLLLDEKGKGESGFGTGEVVDHVKNLVMAGSETTSNFLTGLLFLLFQHPSAAAKLRAEVDACIGSDSDISAETLKKMTYLDNVVNQTSRMFCSGTSPFERQALCSTSLGGVLIEKGVTVMPHWIASFYDPRLFDNPLQFRPQRWDSPECRKNLGLISLIFSGGPRSCIGRSLALAEIKVMAVKFMQRYGGLKEVGERVIELRLTYHIVSNEAILTRRQDI